VTALFYLSWTSARNRFASQLRRIRTPRYALALIVGVAYIYSFLLRPGMRGAAGTMLLGKPTEMLATLLVFVTLTGAWVFGSDLTALAFTQAELSMLFPAPLTRRQLILYKLYRAQLAVVINAAIWVFLLKRGGTALPSPLRAIGIWAMFSMLNLHRLAAALVRASWGEHGKKGARRNAWSLLVFVALLALLAAGLIVHRAELLAVDGIGSFFTVLGSALSTGPARIALYPFHLVVAPTFARTTAEWSREIMPALAIIAVHVWWVLRTDTAFEDAAIEASAERAKRAEANRARRSTAAMGAPRSTATFQLAAKGHPAAAIFWKNMLCLRRTARLRLLIGPAVMAIALGAAFTSGRRDLGAFIATSALMLSAMLLVFGGRLIRNDLRHDMLNLALLKSLPMSTADVVLAEVASSALPMSVMQLALVIVAYVASMFALENPVGPAMRLGILIAAPFAVLALNGALLTIQNGIAVLFPGWTRLGPVVNTGVEALGQNVLATAANLISLGIGLLIPGALALGAGKLLHQPAAVTIALVVIVTSLILAVETYGAMVLLGRALAHAEPSQAV
jgi:hypothetical protein